MDAALSVASGAQSVTVTAAPPLVQTDSVDAGRVVGERQLSELPLPTRNYTQILGLSPGAMENLPNNTDLGRGDLDFYVNGQRDTSNNVVLDGTIITSPGTNSTPSLAVPSPDSLQEFIVQTSLYDATQGRNTGGNLAVVTKSGTNSFHGNAFEFFRNSALNANDYFLKQSGGARPELCKPGRRIRPRHSVRLDAQRSTASDHVGLQVVCAGKALGGRVPSGNRPRGCLADRSAARRAQPCPVELRVRPNELSRSDAAHAGQAVWSAAPIALGPGSRLYDRGEPFTEFTFQPGQGVNPPDGKGSIDDHICPAQLHSPDVVTPRPNGNQRPAQRRSSRVRRTRRRR